MNWTKRKGTTGKVEPLKSFLNKKNLHSKERFQMLYWIMIFPKLLFWISTRPLSPMYLLGSIHFHRRGKKRPNQRAWWQKTNYSDFCCFSYCAFLPVQLIYQGKSKICLPKFACPTNFHVTYTPNHWSNLEKCEDLFKIIIFPYLSAKKKELGYPEEQWSLIIMDTFKGQDNDEMKRLCA